MPRKSFGIQISNSRGSIILGTLIFASISAIVMTGMASWAGANYKLSQQVFLREKTFQVAEAGIEYYRWHLAHAPQDFKDGTATSGPYIHDYFDKDGNKIGTFELTITPPLVGSTVVTVVSRGRVVDNPDISRAIEVKMAIPSLAKYAVVANTTMRFGAGTEIFGPIHANGGVRFDGLAHNIITSALSKYEDPDHNGDNEFGVHTHIKVPPASGTQDSGLASEEAGQPVPIRTDVFMVGRQFPVPAVDFAGLTADLSSLKTLAKTSSGLYFDGSGKSGYLMVLKTNDTFDLYKVNSLVDAPHNCQKQNNVENQNGWGSWSVKTKSLVGNYAFPANGVVFMEDHVWVEGKVNTARLTIASGRFPENENTNTSITVNHDLLYTNYDGQDIVALVAQNNFNIGLESEDDLEIDAALIAKNGRVGRYYYKSECNDYRLRDKIKLFGSLATNKRYGFAYASGSTITSGYVLREIVYDGNLLYSPPPSFPLTSDQYQTISWREVK